MTASQEALADITTAHLSDVSPYGRVMSPRIQSMWSGARILGPAYTVRVAPGDNASLMTAIAQAAPGDVIVADGSQNIDRALWGAIMARAAQLRGIAGLVADAAVRDRDEVREMGFPIFAMAWSPIGPYNKVSGFVDGPITCGDVAVEPGDLICGDGDGVIVIPKSDRDATLERARDRIQREESILQGLEEGRQLPDLLGLLRSEVRP